MSSKLLKKYIRNYLGALALLIALLAPIYLAVYGETRERILAEKSNLLRREVDELDSQISKMQFITDMLRGNEAIDRIARHSGELGIEDSMSLRDARGFLADCLRLGSSDVQEEEFLLFHRNDIVLTNSEIITHPVYHDYSDVIPVPWEFAELQKIIFEDNWMIQYLPYTEEESGILGVLKGPSYRFNAFDMALVFRMSNEKLRQMVGIDENSAIDFAYIEGVDGEILYRINYEGDSILQSEDSVLQSGASQEIILDGQRYSLLRIEADTCGLIWTIGVSAATINQEIASVNQIIMIYVIISLMVMVVICVYWALRRSRAMNRIFEKLKLETGEASIIRNEYKYLTFGVERLQRENETYKDKVAELSGSASHSMLEKLLNRGIYSDKEREEVLRYLNWDMEFYCVVCAIAEDVQQDEQLLDLFYQLDTALYGRFEYLAIHTGREERTYIIRLQGEEEANTAGIASHLQKIALSIGNVHMGISTIGTELENVQLCYRQARLMVRQITDNSEMRARAYCETGNEKNRVSRLNPGTQLYDLIYAKEKNGLRKAFDKIRAHAMKNIWQNEQDVMRFYFEIQSPIFRAWNEIELADRGRELPGYRSDCKIIDLIDELEAAALYLCDCMINNTIEKRTNLRDQIQQFVDEHYSRKEMCVGFAAEHFGFSEKRFSALFKELTGENFSIYVENLRFIQAERCLLETDWEIQKIADTIGYNSLDTFYKSFRKRYGMAPGKWKEQRLAGKDSG